MAKKTQKTEKQEVTKEKQVIENDEKTVEEPVQEAEESKEEPVEEKSQEDILTEKLAELQDKYLRLSAEYDNYRKRTLKEKMDLQESSKTDVFVNLLPVLDDLDRAMDSIDTAEDVEAVKEGMKLIYTKFSGYLTSQGVKEIEAKGKKLDTDVHEAISVIPVESKKQKGKIVDVVEKGYILKERVIRFAKVVIGE